MTDTALTDNDKGTFLEALAAGLSVTGAAAKSGRSRQAFYGLAKRDPEFAEARQDAIDAGTECLEDEARRRAFEGTLKPVFQGGKHVGDIREYSDHLLIFLLKARNPGKYRDRTDVEVSGGVSVSLVNFTGEPIGKFGPDLAPAIDHEPVAVNGTPSKLAVVGGHHAIEHKPAPVRQ